MIPFPSDAILRVLVSGVITDGRKIPRTYYNKIAPLLTEFNRWNDTLSDFDTSKPQTWLKTGMRMTGMLVEQEHPSRIDPVERFLADSDCEGDAPDCLEFVMSDVFHDMPMEVVLQTSARTIYRTNLTADKETFILIVKDNPPIGGKEDEEDEDFDPEYIGDVFLQNDTEKCNESLRILGDMFWAKDHKMIFVDKSDDMILVKDHKLSDRVYKGETYDVLMSMEKFRTQGIRRVVVLQGSPGTGKSTLCENIAETVGNKVMVLSNAMIMNVDRDGWFSLMNMMRPSLVIIDDIDRIAGSRLENSLYLFEDNNYHVPLTLLTTNDKDKLPLAFRRPGRIDMLLEMPLPEDAIRRKIVLEFSRSMGINEVPDSHMNFLMSIMDKYPGAYIKELMLRYKAYGFNYRIPANDMVFGSLQEMFDSMAARAELGEITDAATPPEIPRPTRSSMSFGSIRVSNYTEDESNYMGCSEEDDEEEDEDED
jgi:hypothetical protein